MGEAVAAIRNLLALQRRKLRRNKLPLLNNRPPPSNARRKNKRSATPMLKLQLKKLRTMLKWRDKFEKAEKF